MTVKNSVLKLTGLEGGASQRTVTVAVGRRVSVFVTVSVGLRMPQAEAGAAAKAVARRVMRSIPGS